MGEKGGVFGVRGVFLGVKSRGEATNSMLPLPADVFRPALHQRVAARVEGVLCAERRGHDAHGQLWLAGCPLGPRRLRAGFSTALRPWCGSAGASTAST
jgi:hypothetical protein